MEPRMLKASIERDALLGVLRQQLGEQILALLADAIPAGQVELQFIFQRHLDGFFLGLVIEGQRARQQSIDDAAIAPEVAAGRVRLLLEHLRRHITESTERLIGLFIGPNHLGETKVDEFGYARFSII